jgi:hypothetical protein
MRILGACTCPIAITRRTVPAHSSLPLGRGAVTALIGMSHGFWAIPSDAESGQRLLLRWSAAGVRRTRIARGSRTVTARRAARGVSIANA